MGLLFSETEASSRPKSKNNRVKYSKSIKVNSINQRKTSFEEEKSELLDDFNITFVVVKNRKEDNSEKSSFGTDYSMESKDSEIDESEDHLPLEWCCITFNKQLISRIPISRQYSELEKEAMDQF